MPKKTRQRRRSEEDETRRRGTFTPAEEDEIRIGADKSKGEGEHYDLALYLTTGHADGECATEVIRSRYYAVSIERLLSLMQQAGFRETTRIDGALFQPVLVGIA